MYDWSEANVKVTGDEDHAVAGMLEDLGWRGTREFKITTSVKENEWESISSPFQESLAFSSSS